MKKIPLRTCMGCNEKRPKKELIRIVKQKDGNVEVIRNKNKNTLTLITCKRNTQDRQLVVIFYLSKKENY